MKKEITLLVIAVLVLVGWTQMRRTTWEYRTEYSTATRPIEFTQLGREGWELVAIQSKSAELALFFFKRPK